MNDIVCRTRRCPSAVRRLVKAGFCGFAVLLGGLILVNADEPAGARQTPRPDNASRTRPDEPAVPAPRPDAAQRDPFTYGSCDDGGYVRLADANVPADIQLLGVVIMKGEKPMAAIRVPGVQDVLFVTEGSIARIPHRRSASKETTTTEPLYIFISRISADEVEISPRTRPQDKRILR